MNKQDIIDAIQELENCPDTTFNKVSKLASLYIVRNNLQSGHTPVVNGQIGPIQMELEDMLPRYLYYVDTKRQYQLGTLPEQTVVDAMTGVCQEIKEFVYSLYSGTSTPQERKKIRCMIEELVKI